jgi:dihydroxyacetone kinase
VSRYYRNVFTLLYFFYRHINTNIIRSGSLEDVYALAQLANANLVSLGSSLEHVHVPGRGVPEDTIPHGEVEVGMGIHNEPGSHRVKFDLVELVQGMLLQLLDHNDPDRCYVTRKPEDEFVLLINNLGGVSPLELAGITDEVYRQLKRDYQVNMVRVIQGTFLTSLNGLGFSISLMKLVDPGLGVKTTMLELLDAPAEAVGWSAPINTSTWEKNLNADPVDLKNSNLAEDIHSNLQRKFLLPHHTNPLGLFQHPKSNQQQSTRQSSRKYWAPASSA